MRKFLAVGVVTVCLAFFLFEFQLGGPELEPTRARSAPPQNAVTSPQTSLMDPIGGQDLSQRVTVPPSNDLEATSASEADGGEDGDPSTRPTQVYWKDQFEEKYVGYSPSEIETKRHALWRVYDVAIREYGREYLDRGDFIELDHPNPPELHLIPQSSVAGEGITKMAFSVPQGDGTIRYRWVFFQPSSVPEETKSLGLEINFLAIRAQEMGVFPDGRAR